MTPKKLPVPPNIHAVSVASRDRHLRGKRLKEQYAEGSNASHGRNRLIAQEPLRRAPHSLHTLMICFQSAIRTSMGTGCRIDSLTPTLAG